MLQSASNSALPYHQFLFNPTTMPVPYPYQPQQTQSSASNFQLPRTLERPPFTEVSRFNLKAVVPELADVPLEYSRKRLRAQASQLMSGLCALSSIPSSISKAQLSQTRSLTIPLRSSVQPTSLPTHILALSPSKSSSSDVLLFPVHSIALALSCASLPRIPPYTPKISSQDTVSLPIVSLSLPSPSSFPPIQSYLYTHDPSALLTSLLGSPSALPPSFLALLTPSHAPPTIKSTLASGQKLHQLSLHMCEVAARDLQLLMGRAAVIVGCWRNIVALGVSDPDMWDVLDLAYEVLLGAINLAAQR